MHTITSISCFSTSTKSPFHTSSPKPFFRRNPPKVCFFRASANPVRELAEDDVLKTFLKDRIVNGDFISKASDMFWLREALDLVDSDDATFSETSQEADQVMENQEDGGFLKLTRTQEWISGADSAPINRKVIAKAMQDDRDRRKKLNFLQYEALKRELMLLSVGIGAACSGYCLVALSLQAAVSYAVGVLFSCLYLQLLCSHADTISKEKIPPIFMKKKTKKIGIRSDDLSDSFERSIRGIGIALSSPRLVIPAAIYGLWVLSHQYFGSVGFDFQIVPAMFGMFVYKAAALVQVYRDNEDLQLIMPENVDDSSD